MRLILSNYLRLTKCGSCRIIWLVLSWDASEFRKAADAIEKAKGPSSPSKAQLAAIKAYLKQPRDEHDDTRKDSLQTAKSIVVAILERSKPDLLPSLSETQHAQCLEYLSALLAARDRDEIANALCRQNPDLFTQAIKDAVASFEPMIRSIHQHVDLREHVSAAEGFIAEFIHVSKAKKSSSGLLGSLKASASKRDPSETSAPSVEDYVILLRNNRQLVYNWLHQLASQCPEIRADFCAWAKETIKLFRQSTPPVPDPASPPDPHTPRARPGAAGSLSAPLQDLFASLPPATRSRILPTISAHATYLSTLETLSLARMQHILDNMPPNPTAATTTITTSASTPTTPTLTPSSASASSYFSPAFWSGRSTPRATTPTPQQQHQHQQQQRLSEERSRSFAGPGMYLSRWQHLLDDTLVGPAELAPGAGGGALRTGREVKGLVTRGKTGSGSGSGSGSAKEGGGGWDPAALARVGEAEEPGVVDVTGVVEALGEGFWRLVQGRVGDRDRPQA